MKKKQTNTRTFHRNQYLWRHTQQTNSIFHSDYYDWHDCSICKKGRLILTVSVLLLYETKFVFIILLFIDFDFCRNITHLHSSIRKPLSIWTTRLTECYSWTWTNFFRNHKNSEHEKVDDNISIHFNPIRNRTGTIEWPIQAQCLCEKITSSTE